MIDMNDFASPMSDNSKAHHPESPDPGDLNHAALPPLANNQEGRWLYQPSDQLLSEIWRAELGIWRFVAPDAPPPAHAYPDRLALAVTAYHNSLAQCYGKTFAWTENGRFIDPVKRAICDSFHLTPEKSEAILSKIADEVREAANKHWEFEGKRYPLGGTWGYFSVDEKGELLAHIADHSQP
jgi:hypothetical protein